MKTLRVVLLEAKKRLADQPQKEMTESEIQAQTRHPENLESTSHRVDGELDDVNPSRPPKKPPGQSSSSQNNRVVCSRNRKK